MFRFALSLLLLFAIPAAAQTANPRPYTTLYVFGDSYSDSGAGYVDADGPTAVVYLAQRLGIPFTYYGDPQSNGKGLNFAVSAASSGEGPPRRYPAGPMLGYGMKNQVDDFVRFSKLKLLPPIDAANTLFFFAGGLNDGRRPEGFTRASIEAEIDALYELGARRFMVALLPVRIPAFAAAGQRANKELPAVITDEKTRHPDIRIGTSDWGPYFDEVLTHPAKYGITDTTHECAPRSFGGEPVTSCASPGSHFYFHDGHPSTAAHRAVGDLLFAEALTKAP